jgi:hypothetical protein
MATKLIATQKTSFAELESGEFIFTDYDAEFVPHTMMFKHPQCRFNKCSIGITKGEAKHPVWHWDGNKEKPTITPSIGCDVKPRCGQHFSITNGEIVP